MPVSVSLINMKGGVGKTTLAFNLAWHASFKRAKRVLVVDLDPQANASQYLMGAAGYLSYIKANKGTVVDILEQFTPAFHGGSAPSGVSPGAVIYNVRAWPDGGRVDLIPSRLELAWTLKNPTSKDHLLAKFLADHASAYDLILIDCAPTESILTLSAYRASRFVLVPVKPEFLAAIGLPLLVRSLNEFHTSFGQHRIEIAGVVFTDSDPQHVKPEHEAGRRDVHAVAAANGWTVFKNELRHSDSYPRGARNGDPIFLTDHARWWVIGEFDKLGEEFMKEIGL
ncbi:chromosome partitioning protein ParA [Methylosinus sp. C49]|uniref:ParA family protein n=1 Tax=Methylosinus sp. C49 TaxID=2699395 RepID=UPI0013676153|nr:ParA family protein [Methylosinus sp. C49]BBU63084.1 chromosome partitioning protein ParA [Methylosinus sp. C49]